MAPPNGHDTGAELGLSLPTEVISFRIGGKDIPVPALTFAALERAKESVLAIGPTNDFVEYSAHVLRIVAAALADTKPEFTYEILAKYCSGAERRLLAASMNDLLRISGFDMGEAEAVNREDPGIGTLTASAPNLLSEASAEETPG